VPSWHDSLVEKDSAKKERRLMPAGSNQVVSEFYPLKRREIRAQFDGRAISQ